MAFMLFLAGLDTVTNAMGYGLRHLAAHPDDQAALRVDRAAIPEAVEAVLRRYSFINTVRTATREVALDGVAIQEGEGLTCIMWGGSNDPAAVGESRHFGFGFGPHLCLGAALARLEMRVMFETWFAVVGPFALDPARPAVMHGGTVMGIERLPLILRPRTGAGAAL
jgi:cytochrome P450